MNQKITDLIKPAQENMRELKEAYHNAKGDSPQLTPEGFFRFIKTSQPAREERARLNEAFAHALAEMLVEAGTEDRLPDFDDE